MQSTRFHFWVLLTHVKRLLLELKLKKEGAAIGHLPVTGVILLFPLLQRSVISVISYKTFEQIDKVIA